MWKAIRNALRAIADAFGSTTSALVYGVKGAADWMLDIWNAWARRISGTNYRPERVTDATDHVEAMTAMPEPDVSPHDDKTELGRRVRLAAQAILDGAKEAPGDLPGEVQIWLLARSSYDLTLTVRATDEAVGRHLSGVETLRGPHGSEVPGVDLRRDEKILLVRIEAARPKVREHWEQEQIRELFSVRTPTISSKAPAPAPAMPTAVLTPSY